jgi:hypothetical protein
MEERERYYITMHLHKKETVSTKKSYIHKGGSKALMPL